MVSHHFFFRHMFRPLDLKDQKSLRQKNSKVPKLPNPEFSKESDLCRRRKLGATVICHPVYLPHSILCRVVDQFQNLEGIAGRILGYFSQSPTFFVREIFDGIAPNAGGNYIHSGYSHRRRLAQSRVKYHGLPEAPLVRADHDSWIFWDEIFRARNFFKEISV